MRALCGAETARMILPRLTPPAPFSPNIAAVVRPIPPTPIAPDADLAALERELEELLVRFEVLDATWRKAPRALDRWALGKEHDATLACIRDLQDAIARTPARTLADAAVLLRRLNAWLDDGTATELQMLRSALDVVEANVPGARA